MFIYEASLPYVSYC